MPRVLVWPAVLIHKKRGDKVWDRFLDNMRAYADAYRSNKQELLKEKSA